MARSELLAHTGLDPASRAEILAPDGQPVDARFSTSVAGTAGRRTYSLSTTELNGAVDVRPALLPGRYTLRIRMADKSNRDIPFDIEAERVADVVVDLSTL